MNRDEEIREWLRNYGGKSSFVRDLRRKVWDGHQLTDSQRQVLEEMIDDPRPLKQKVDDFLATYDGDYPFLLDIQKLRARGATLTFKQKAAVDKCRRKVAQTLSRSAE